MAVPIALAGAGIAARGFASYMAKKKAKEAAMKAGYGSVPAATMPNLVTTSKSINPVAGTAGLVASGVAGYNVGEYQNGLKSLSKNKGNYGMVGPMTEYRSQDPSYDASMTREGKIQTMMEEMDGMDMTEDAKRQIIADKLGVMINGNNADYGGPLGSVEKKKIQDDIDEMKKEFARRNTGAAYTNQEVGDPFNTGRLMEGNPHFKGMYPDVEPMDEVTEDVKKEDSYFQKRLKEASGAGKFLMDPTGLIRKGGNKALKMFMGRPVQTSGYDRGPIRPRYDEFGNLIPQRPTMMV